MTLGLSWATNTNYSTGPDVGTPTKVNPSSAANGFIKGVIAAPQHVNWLFHEVDAQLARAVDGVGGGTYELTAALEFQGNFVRIGDGAELRFIDGATLRLFDGCNLVLEADADIIVNAGCEVIIEDGGQVTVNDGGALALLDGGGMAVASGGFVQLQSGGKILCLAGAEIQVHDAEDLTIDDSVGAFRLSLTPQSIGADSGGTDPAWRPRLSGTPFAGTPCGWYQHDVLFQPCIAFPVSLPYGDDITTVTVSVDGSSAGVNHAAKPTGADLPVVSLVQVDTSGVATVLARRKDQSVDVGAYNAQHTIVLASGALDDGAMPQTLDPNYAYYVVVHGETGANAEADKFAVTGVSGQTVARSYRSFVTMA